MFFIVSQTTLVFHQGSVKTKRIIPVWPSIFRVQFVQFSSVAQLCPTLCDPMDCSVPGLPVHHQLPEFTQTPTISSSVFPFSSLLQSFPASGSFPVSQFFTSDGQSIGVFSVHLYNRWSNSNKMNMPNLWRNLFGVGIGGLYFPIHLPINIGTVCLPTMPVVISRCVAVMWASLVAQSVKNPPAMQGTAWSIGDLDSIPASGRSHWEENGNPLQYAWLGNPMDRGALWATVYGIARVGHDLETKPPPAVMWK